MKGNRSCTHFVNEQSENAVFRKSKKVLSTRRKHLCNSWDTRTRTKNDRTRICSVTITPYPNIEITITKLRCKITIYF